MKKKLFILPLLFLISCASFQSRLTKDFKRNLNENMILNFHGKYECVSHSTFLKYGESDDSKTIPIFDILDDSTQSSKIAENNYIEVDFPNRSNISFKLYSDKTLVRQITISGKLKKNGFFHLDNKLRKCHGLPYILGGCYIRKTRVGISKSKDLIMNNAIDNYGAFMLLLGFGYDYNVAYLYRPLE